MISRKKTQLFYSFPAQFYEMLVLTDEWFGLLFLAKLVLVMNFFSDNDSFIHYTTTIFPANALVFRKRFFIVKYCFC